MIVLEGEAGLPCPLAKGKSLLEGCRDGASNLAVGGKLC